MEITIFDEKVIIDTGFNYNVTKRERNPVSRTSDANSGFVSNDLGNLCYDLDCVIFGKLDHKFRFRDALKSQYYYDFDNIMIDSAFSLIDKDLKMHEIVSDLTAGYAIGTLLPVLVAYDGKSYDIFSILKDKLSKLPKNFNINPNTFFVNNILMDSGFTEIARYCGPITILKRYRTNIKLISTTFVTNGSTTTLKLNSNIQLFEILYKG